jgi:PAS domain S-box-containing protein
MLDDRSYTAVRHLAAIVDSSDDCIVSKDLNGIIKSWNRAAERMFGYTADEAVGKPIRIIIPADRQDEEDEVLRRIRNGETVDHFETIRQHKNGTLFPISLTISPIRDVDGTIIGASKIARDISERVRTQAALAEATVKQADLQRRLVALVTASGSLLGSPRVEDVVPAILKLAGEVLTADAYALWRFDTAQKVWRIAAHLGLSAEFGNALVSTHDGREAEAMTSAAPIVGDDVETVPALRDRLDVYRREGIRSVLVIPLAQGGTAAATLAFYYRSPRTFSDVDVESARALGNIAAGALRTADLYSERRQREHQALFLARSAAALASSLDYRETLKTLAQLAVPQIADWCTVDIVVGGAIDRLAMAHSNPDKLAVARRVQQKYPSRVDDPHGLAEVLRTGNSLMVKEVTDAMIVSGAKDPEHLEALRSLSITSVMIVPLRTRQGTIGAISFVSSAPARRFTDADLRFAETVADRAAAAVENAWAYEEARTANQLKDEFLATLSHELRTPLNAMLGYTRMLRAEAVPAARREGALEVVERNGQLLAQIVDEVLDVSRIISGKLRLNMQRMDVARLIDDALAIVAPAAEARGIELRSSVTTNLALQGDPDRLQQVLWNLLTNAVKFTPTSGRVDVDVRSSDNAVEIIVTDTGRGIDPAFLPYIFERFRQADSRFTREHGGLGLGLSIARHIVEMHGGTIHAESAGEGRGATFRVRLPALGGVERVSSTK